MRHNKFGKLYCKVALTGGPCAGKTTALIRIGAEIAKSHPDWQVFRVAEAATLLYNGGVYRNDLSEEQLLTWQEGILLTIIRLEDVYGRIADYEQKHHTLMLCDRGCLDAKVYAETQHWTAILEKNKLSEEEILKRYDAVLHFRSAPAHYYSRDNNRLRRETFSEAQEKDAKYALVYAEHEHYVPIDNREGGFEQKIREAVEVIDQMIKEAAAAIGEGEETVEMAR